MSSSRVDPAAATPPDQAARDRVATDLASTLFVEAGAGSGKTKALVDRITALIQRGIAVEQIAAITFTEKAAAELRQRLRVRLEQAASFDDPDERCRLALGQLDGAAISTLHSFAQRILFEHPIEAGLPPGVEVLDELGSQVAFDDRWDLFVPELLARPDLAASLLVADVSGITTEMLRGLAVAFEDNWDLLAGRLDRDPPPPQISVAGLVAELSSFAMAADECRDPQDRLAARCLEVGEYATRLGAADRVDKNGDPDDPIDRLIDLAELLGSPSPAFATKSGTQYASFGNAANWPDRDRMAGLRGELFAIGRHRDQLRRRLVEATIHHLAAAIGAFVLEGVAERRREGRLRFHDLLVLAREVLRDPFVGAEVRASVAARYQRLLIDEFQDTDPIQVELAVLIAGEGEIDGRAWSDITTGTGRLFFVGDPKQSIYRFRRADIGTYLSAQNVFGGTADQVQLRCNFRSSRPVIDWVNHTFDSLIQPEPGSQPAYLALHPIRPAPASGPGVYVLGAIAHPGKQSAADLRALEAVDVLRTIRLALDQGWSVSDRSHDGSSLERPCRLGDITILLPARTSLPELERAFERSGVAYRAETASLVYSTWEVRDLMMVARALDDPTDELAVIAALRSSAFGCGDDDLARHQRRHGSRWDHQHLPDDLDPDDLVGDALLWLADAHRRRTWSTPATTLEQIVRDRRILELGVLGGRHREVARRIRFVIDQARSWSDSIGGDLREYLSWARLQASDGSRVVETVLPETDADAVRIMTIHAAKGLEFPITIVSGLTTQAGARRSSVHVTWPPNGGIGYRLGSANITNDYEAFVPIDEQMDGHERIRLLYVACTRAVDHLVVSMHRASTGASSSLASMLAAATDADAVGADTGDADLDAAVVATQGLGTIQPVRAKPWSPPRPWPTRAQWLEEHERQLAHARRTRTVSATTIATAVGLANLDPGLAKAPRNLDLPPWQRGRYGTAIGRAVHGVLQVIDLATGNGLAAASAAQAAAEGVLGREGTIERLAASALASATVAAAASARHWRELYVAAPVGDRLLEGYVDLLYETETGLVVVDYKTDAVATDEALEAKVARYRVQVAAYALAVEAATGRRVERAILLFLTEDRPIEITIDELGAARALATVTMGEIVDGADASVDDR